MSEIITYDVAAHREQEWAVYHRVQRTGAIGPSAEFQIDWAGLWVDTTQLRVNWSCVGAVDVAEARAFAQALLDVCNAAEARLALGPMIADIAKRKVLPS